MINSETFTLQRLELLKDKLNDGQFLWQNLKIPYIELATPPFSVPALLQEARAVEKDFVPHRESDSAGWQSLCLHGLSPEHTRHVEFYGYTREEEAPYVWTEAAEKCPQTVLWLKQLLTQGWFQTFHRVRFMWLKPGGYISYHQDRPSQDKRLGPLNVALNMPEGCKWMFRDWGPVPFRDGSSFAVDISNQHGVWNHSTDDRIHIIVHGKYGPEYYRQISEASLAMATVGKKSAGKKSTAPQPTFGPSPYYSPPPRLSIGMWMGEQLYLPQDFLKKCCGVTRHFLKIAAFKPLPTADDCSLRNLLSLASHQKSDYAVIVKPGQIVAPEFLWDLEQFCARNTSSYIDLSNPNSWMLIHIPSWDRLGQPDIAKMRKDPLVYGVKDIPSSLNYLVLDLDPTPESQNLIETHLNGFTLDNFQDGPDTTDPTGQQKACRYLDYELQGWRKKVFLFNTEGYNDINNTKLTTPVDSVFSLASGFKDLFFIHKLKLTPDAELIYYDVSTNALQFKKLLYELWDGRDFPNFLRQVRNSESLRGTVFAVDDLRIDDEWREELAKWPSPDAFAAAFLRAKTMKKEFLNLDITDDPSLLEDRISEKRRKSILLWYSNCFGYSPTVAANGWNPEIVAQKGARLIQRLDKLSRDKKIILFGENVWHGCKIQLHGHTPTEALA